MTQPRFSVARPGSGGWSAPARPAINHDIRRWAFAYERRLSTGVVLGGDEELREEAVASTSIHTVERIEHDVLFGRRSRKRSEKAAYIAALKGELS